MTTSGNFGRLFANGVELTGDGSSAQWTHAFEKIKVMVFGTGIQQSAVGAFHPKLSLNAYINDTLNAQTAANLLTQSGLGAADIEYLTMLAIGQNALPTVGDVAFMAGLTLGSLKPDIQPKGALTFQGVMEARGRLSPRGRVIGVYNGADNAYVPTIFDNGANSVGTLKGGGFMLQVLSPTGTAAAGNITVPTQPVAADTVVVNGVTYTWVSSIGSTPGNVLIGATALASAQNLWAAATSGLGVGTTYITVSAANAALLAEAYYSLPSGGSNIITITYKTTGTAGNAFTLTKTGTGGLTVSGATLTGGVAGDALSFTLQTATTSAGSYTTRATSALNGTVRGADYQSIAIGTTMDEFVKLAISGATGQNVSFVAAFGRFYS